MRDDSVRCKKGGQCRVAPRHEENDKQAGGTVLSTIATTLVKMRPTRPAALDCHLTRHRRPLPTRVTGANARLARRHGARRRIGSKALLAAKRVSE